VQSRSVFFAPVVMLAVFFASQASYAGVGTICAPGAFGQAITGTEDLLTPTSGHGAGGGSVFWPTGTPYGPIYSDRRKSCSPHLCRRVKNR
jgi:hypothetical protein